MKSSSSRRSVLASALTVVALLVPAVAVPSGLAAKEIRIATSSTSFGNVSVRLADELGLFRKHGLEVKFIVMDNANTATTALLSQSVDLALAGPSQALVARARNQPVGIVSRVYQGLAAYVVLAKTVATRLGIAPDAPVASRFRALDGLSVAEPSPTSAYVAPVRAGAQAAGAKIKLVYMEQTAMPAALESGAVEAIVLGSPLWGDVVLRGSGILWIRGPAGEFPPDLVPAASSALLATETFAAASPDVIKAVRATMDDLATTLRDHPDDAKKAIARIFSQIDPRALDLAFDQEWKNWTKPEMDADDVRQEIRILQSLGGSVPNLDRLDPAKLIIPNG